MERETFLLTMTTEKWLSSALGLFPLQDVLLQSHKKNTGLLGHGLEGLSWGYAMNHLLLGAKEL